MNEIDNRIAWVGSQNAADPEFRIKPKFAPWVDIMSRWEGPAAPGDWSRIARRIRVPLGFVFAVIYFWLAKPTWLFRAYPRPRFQVL